jgi:streptogramin lyase
MKLKILILLIAVAVMFGWHVEAQTYDTNGDYVQTFAGSAFSGHLDGQGTQTMFANPSQVVADTSSNLFVLDGDGLLIRKITPNATVSTFAGGGTGSLPGCGTNIALGNPNVGTSGAMIIDHSNVLWLVYNNGNNDSPFVRITPNGCASLSTNFNGLSLQSGVCVDSENNIYFSTYYGNQIYCWRTSGVLELFAGSGNGGAIDGNGIFTSFNHPTALACDEANNIYVWDSGNYLIRRIDQNQNVTTITGAGTDFSSSGVDGVGTNATFNNISSMFSDNDGNIYFVCGTCIRKMDAQTNVVTMAGSFTQSGYTNGAGNLARFNGVFGADGSSGACMAQGMIFVGDSGNNRIRNITFNPQPQVVTGANLGIGTYAGVTINGVVGRTYQIQSSPDLSNWTTVATVLLTSSPYLWIDQNPISGNKFYSAVLLP